MADPTLSHKLDQFTATVSLVEPGEAHPISYQLAGAGARCLAGVFDLLIQAALFSALAWGALLYRPDLFPQESWPWAIPVGFIELHLIYHMLCESITGSSLGMRAVGVRLISTTGGRSRPLRIILRTLCRVPDLLLTGYALSFFMITRSAQRQGFGDRIASTLVLYRAPLRQQMAISDVPESLYSTSEAGYLLQAWMQRNSRMDMESKSASALDLAAYLHSTYDPDARDLPEPAIYLRDLFEKEMAEPPVKSAIAKSE